MIPCAPIRLMPDAAWRQFLAAHPGWRPLLRVLGPCVRAGALAGVMAVPGAVDQVPASGVADQYAAATAPVSAGPATVVIRPAADVARDTAAGGSPAPYLSPAPILPRAPLTLGDLPAAALPDAPARAVPEPSTLALVGAVLVLAAWPRRRA